ncbi:MAG: hypothetical protein ACKVWV_20015 [Planctomycetota bacterium]
MGRFLLLLFVLVAWCDVAAAQVPWQTCTVCGATGKLCCQEHEGPQCAAEEDVLYCSVIAGCSACGGTGYVPCSACVNPEARKKLEERRASIPGRAGALESIDDTMGRPLRKAETAHFVFVWEMEGIKVDKRMVEPHEALHLYCTRMEALFADYCRTLAIDDSHFREKTWVFVWFLAKDHVDGSRKFCESSPTRGGVKLMGIHSRYSILGNRSQFRTDAQLHRNIVHSVSHLLLSAQRPTAWIGNMKGGWIDEGLAHWFEDRVSGICDNYCMQEANPNVSFENGKYRLGIRRLVAKGELPPIPDITSRNVDVLTVEMNAIVFSYVDYLIPLGADKLDALVKKLKNRIPASEAVRDVYGMNLLELEEKWKAWVLETYPVK